MLNQNSIPFPEGSLCHQLATNALDERVGRLFQITQEQKPVASVKAVAKENLTRLQTRNSNFQKGEMNPHENFYRENFEQH